MIADEVEDIDGDEGFDDEVEVDEGFGGEE